MILNGVFRLISWLYYFDLQLLMLLFILIIIDCCCHWWSRNCDSSEAPEFTSVFSAVRVALLLDFCVSLCG